LKTKEPAVKPSTSAEPTTENPEHGYCPRQCHPHGGQSHNHGHWHGHGRRGQGPHGRRDDRFFIEKLTSKRDQIAADLVDPEVGCDEYKKQKLQRKLDSIERRLSSLNSTSATTTTADQIATEEKTDQETHKETTETANEWRKRKSYKWKKCHETGGQGEKYAKRKSRKNLSEEALKEIHQLKSQIWELKPSLRAVHNQLHEKKALMEEAKKKEEVQRVQELMKEIDQLHDIKREHKRAIAPLKQRIRALKFDEC